MRDKHRYNRKESASVQRLCTGLPWVRRSTAVDNIAHWIKAVRLQRILFLSTDWDDRTLVFIYSGKTRRPGKYGERKTGEPTVCARPRNITQLTPVYGRLCRNRIVSRPSSRQTSVVPQAAKFHSSKRDTNRKYWLKAKRRQQDDSLRRGPKYFSLAIVPSLAILWNGLNETHDIVVEQVRERYLFTLDWSWFTLPVIWSRVAEMA